MKTNFEIENEAKEMSINYPDVTYYVIGKKRNEAKIYSIGYLAMQKINNEKWYPICSYKNGIRR